jgi:hypothetical protein
MNNKLFVSGFTFVRNAIVYDYPIVEAISSILPVCDELIVNVGDSEDDTLRLIQSIPSEKIKIIKSVWDKNLRTSGTVLAQQTTIALSHCTGRWCFYIQADEIVHERYLPAISQAASTYADDLRVEGLLFKYLHFYGSYHYVGASRRWYRNEVRIVRNRIGVYSYKDAQGFRIRNNRPLRVKPVDVYMYHYGWVKPPIIQQQKQRFFNRLWHPDEWVEAHIGTDQEYNYHNIDTLEPFTGTHPSVMRQRVATQNWQFIYNPKTSKHHIPLKHRILNYIEKHTGRRIGEYKNYKII